MAKDLNDLLAALTNIENELTFKLSDIVTEYAQNGLALVINKVQTKGIGGESYSQRTMLVTQDVFLQKDKFHPDIIATTLGRDSEGKLVKGGSRNKNKTISKSKTGDRYRYIKFKGASKAVPVMTLQNGYKELRDIQGLQTAFVDVTYSGRMIQNTKVLSVQTEGEGVEVAIIGGGDAETRKKLRGNFIHYGNFLGITPKIAEVINVIPVARVKEIFEKFL